MLEHLIGQWQLRRQVVSVSGALIARMKGIASFAPLEEGISRYHEDGKLMLAGNNQSPIDFSRSYLYREEESGLAVYFDENPMRLFQAITLMAVGGALEGSAIHLCAPDKYSSVYKLNLPNKFQSTHRVEGPRKSYRIFTFYDRSV